MNDKYLELAKKFKALAEQGVGGEKYNAQKKLASLMKRYNITENDIKEDVRSQVKFKMKKDQRKLFYQVYISVTGSERNFWRWKKPPYFYVGEVTPLEELEIRAKFDFYWRLYQQNLDMFFTAFVYKNHLYASDRHSSSDEELTPEEWERFRKIAAMVESIQTAPYRKQLQNG